MPTDTHPDAERHHLELMRSATPKKRLQMMFEMTARGHAMAFDALRRANAELSESDLKVLFVRIHYGDELANGYREFLRKRAMAS